MPPNITPPPHRIMLIGAPCGNLDALRNLLGGLPAELPATIFVVAHSAPGERPSADVMGNRTHLRMKLAEDRLRYAPGEVYIAPANRHLTLEGDSCSVSHHPYRAQGAAVRSRWCPARTPTAATWGTLMAPKRCWCSTRWRWSAPSGHRSVSSKSVA